ncbi:MAG: dihydroneopterin aldolase [Candidatus Cloacimonetes bacterium]|nr:dihydroneopterin aldolase [Candidatus Cloacimonadota bacterium]
MKIRLNKMVFFGYHGTHPEERKLGQRFIVDFELETAGEHDNNIRHIEDTIDYTLVFDLIKETMEKHSYHLMENCANHVLEEVMRSFTEIIRAEIRIKKPSVSINGSLDSAEVIMSRQR